MPSTKFIQEPVLATLVESGAIRSVSLVEDMDGQFHVLATAGSVEYRIERKRGGERTFKSLNAAADLVRSMGISRMTLRMNELKSENGALLL